MQIQKVGLIAIALCIAGSIATGCNKTHAEKVSTFTVYGNCGMCEKTIEGSLKQKGIYSADWDKETKIIQVRFDSTLYTIESIHQLIAASGYDTELTKAPDEAYNALHACCQYNRPL
ncbi:MAG: heavy-metal-associated domain-containing protein [Chitinophagales bacterium]